MKKSELMIRLELLNEHCQEAYNSESLDECFFYIETALKSIQRLRTDLAKADFVIRKAVDVPING
jgi:hypothetical protein